METPEKKEISEESESQEAEPAQEGLPQKEAVPNVESAEDKKLALVILEAKDFRSLWDALREKGGLQGSEKFYTIEDLNERVDAVSKGATPRLLTGAFGFRQKVLDLIKTKKLKEELSQEEKTGLPAGARIVSNELWNISFTSRGGERGAEKMKRFEKEFNKIKKTGWETGGEPIDATLIWTDGEGAIFEDKKGVKFAIPFESIK